MESAQKPLALPAKLGTSILLAVSVSFVILLSALAIFYATGMLRYELYRSTGESFLVAGIVGLSTFAFCFFDFFSPNRFFTGTERAGFVRLICWLSVILPIDAFVESVFIPRLSWVRDGTWFLRWPAEFILAGLLGMFIGISQKKWGWVSWGMFLFLFGSFWVLSIFAE